MEGMILNMKKNKKDKSNKKILNINEEFTSQNFIHTKKLKTIFLITIIIFVLLVTRLAVIQFVDGAYLKEKAYSQQAINQIISPKRGNIYDSTGKTLASSVAVDTITINPQKITDSTDEKTNELKEKVAKGLSDIFELDYNETLEKVKSNSQVETIAKKIDQDKVETLQKWMKENKISVGINIDEDSKRYYPHDTVLSNVLGFCGTDNSGIVGLESTYNSVLQGTPGKIVSSKGSDQEEIPNAEERYISAENGSDLTLTIDYNIQTIVEKYLSQACVNLNAKSGGTCIAMNPKTGKILAMADYPNYNLNTPFTPNSSIASTYDSLSSEDKSNALHSMWRNKCVSDLYEPGSVFKLITASVALEEHITTPDVEGDFVCNGYEQVADKKISCWSTTPHGSLSLRKALEKSCNPALMQLGKRIGVKTLYNYYHAYGLFDTTGSNLYGESNSLFTKESSVADVELATMSFGQRLNITPLQMITAISAIANDGILMKPMIVDKITNTDTGAVTSIEPTQVRQVLSKETANTMKELMESVVVDGTGYRGAVTGYSVGGKTGTSEPPDGKESEGYVASFVAISPVEDTQIVLLVCFYGLNKGQQGGQVAAPVASQMLTEILPIMGVPSESTDTNSSNLVQISDVRNKTFTEAEKVLTNAGFKVKSVTSQNKNETTVSDQVPKPGVSLSKDSIIMLYDNTNTARTSVTVPDLTFKRLQHKHKNALHSLNLNVSIDGTGTVVSQDPPANSKIEEGTVVKITLKKWCQICTLKIIHSLGNCISSAISYIFLFWFYFYFSFLYFFLSPRFFH